MGKTIFFILLSSWLAISHARHLPKYITKCHRSEPDIGDCIRKQVEKLRPRLLKGIPEMHIPAYDPMEIPQLHLEQGTNAVKFSADFKNVRTFGAHHTHINSVRADLENPKLDISLHFPKMRIKTEYEIKGNVLLLPVRGNGASDGNFTDVNANVTLLGNYVYKNGTKYINLTDKRVNLSIGGSNMYFDNFFNGNQELIGSTNKFINQNWKDIIKELNPVLEESIASLVFQLVRHVFDIYPLDELLPP